MSARALHSILTLGPGDWLEVHARGENWMTLWCNDQPSRFDACCQLEDAKVAIVPRMSPDPRDVAVYAGCLWARLETAKHADALARFRRAPSIVIREGKSPRRWALWWLQEPLRLDVVARGNRALAYTLGTVQKHGAEPELTFLPCPGSMLSLGRRKPIAVAVEFVALDRRYRPSDFRGVVRKPPEKSTEWQRRAA